jgi:hypothetical protein
LFKNFGKENTQKSGVTLPAYHELPERDQRHSTQGSTIVDIPDVTAIIIRNVHTIFLKIGKPITQKQSK